MMKNKKMLLGARAFLCASVMTVLCCSCAEKDKSPITVSGIAPDFSLEDLQGKTIRLKDLRGKVVLVNFFATWCAPCIKEVPAFSQLYERYREKGFEIVGIGVDMEGETALRPFSEKLRIPYPVVIGTRKVVLDYGGITGVPTSFFVDRDGYIADQFIGVRPVQILEKNITNLLEKEV